MTGADLRKLERDLKSDLLDTDKAVRERVRILVTEFLLSEAALLADTPVRDEQKILDLIQLHVRVRLLEALIQNPKGFALKDQKELFRSLTAEKIADSTNPLDIIKGLDGLPAVQRAALLDKAMGLARKNLESRAK